MYGVQGGDTFPFGLQRSASIHTHQPVGAVVFTNATGGGPTRYHGFAEDVSDGFSPHGAVTTSTGGVALAESNAGALPILLGFEHR